MRCASMIALAVAVVFPLAAARAEPPSASGVLGGDVDYKPAPAKAKPRPPVISAPAKAETASKPAAEPSAPGAQRPASQNKTAEKASAGKTAPAGATAPQASVKVSPADADNKADNKIDKPAGAEKSTKTGDTRPAKKVFGGAKAPAALAARAIGGYAKGCLAGGRALAIDGPDWQAMRLSRNRNWGHPKLIALLERFAKEMREEENWPGLLIGDLAQPRGGPMTSGHKSHQLGLDADIWYRPMPTTRMTRAERETAEPLLLARDNGAEVIAENYNEGFMRLVRRAAKYPEVERVFVHPAVKKAFCAGAGEDRAWLRKVRPIWLHNYHFHVRMGCPADSPTCTPQKAIEAEGDGCGKDLDDWIKLVSKPARPQPKPVSPPPVPVKPSKPKPPMMVKDLPPECTEVANAADATPTLTKAPAVATAPATSAPAIKKSAERN